MPSWNDHHNLSVGSFCMMCVYFCILLTWSINENSTDALKSNREQKKWKKKKQKRYKDRLLCSQTRCRSLAEISRATHAHATCNFCNGWSNVYHVHTWFQVNKGGRRSATTNNGKDVEIRRAKDKNTWIKRKNRKSGANILAVVQYLLIESLGCPYAFCGQGYTLIWLFHAFVRPFVRRFGHCL